MGVIVGEWQNVATPWPFHTSASCASEAERYAAEHGVKVVRARFLMATFEWEVMIPMGTARVAEEAWPNFLELLARYGWDGATYSAAR